MKFLTVTILLLAVAESNTQLNLGSRFEGALGGKRSRDALENDDLEEDVEALRNALSPLPNAQSLVKDLQNNIDGGLLAVLGPVLNILISVLGGLFDQESTITVSSLGSILAALGNVMSQSSDEVNKTVGGLLVSVGGLLAPVVGSDGILGISGLSEGL